MTMLHNAINSGNLTKVIEILKNSPALNQEYDVNGYRPIKLAILHAKNNYEKENEAYEKYLKICMAILDESLKDAENTKNKEEYVFHLQDIQSICLSSLSELNSSNFPDNADLYILLNDYQKKCSILLNQMKPIFPAVALVGNNNNFRSPPGDHLTTRLVGYLKWKEMARNQGLDNFGKSSINAPLTYTRALDNRGKSLEGVNFSSQDYLGLSSHPAIKAAAIKAINEYGVHSAGSPAAFGNTKYSLQLEQKIASVLGMNEALLFPTGWAAGYGVVKGLVREDDYIIMDKLAHNCLQNGARAATKKVVVTSHLNIAAMEEQLKRIRSQDSKNGILVITETLFSMDSDTPDLRLLQKICKQYNATLLVDIAHDFGCLGKNGRGHLEIQSLLGEIDLVMGSFSKTFGSNGGFVCTNSRSVKEYLKFFSDPQIFSNALSPSQTAVVLKAIEIIQSKEGEELREKLLANSIYLRNGLIAKGLTVLGNPSAIVPIFIGNESLIRVTAKLLLEKGILVNLIEYPGVPIGTARLRIQLMATHTTEQLDQLINGVEIALAQAKKIIKSENPSELINENATSSIRAKL